jgi:hypothetical protein
MPVSGMEQGILSSHLPLQAIIEVPGTSPKLQFRMRSKSLLRGLAPLFAAIFILSGCAISGSIIETPPAPMGAVVGSVTNDAGEPLAGFEVFIDRTSRVASTDATGRFLFDHVPAARYRVVAVTAAGVPFWEGVIVDGDRASSVSIVVDELAEPARRGTNGEGGALDAGLRALIEGGVDNCRITNPEVATVVDTRRSGVVHRSIRSTAPLVVENDYAGYIVDVYVNALDVYTQGQESSFRVDSFMRFREMAAPSTGMADSWRANRSRIYLGSMQHFLRSLAARNLRNDGFAVTRPFQSTHSAPGITGLQETVATWTMVRDDQMVMSRPGSYSNYLNVESVLRISHRGTAVTPDAGRYMGALEVDGRPTSRLALGQSPMQFTRDGLLLTDTAVILEGLWAAPRLCYQLPIDLFVD